METQNNAKSAINRIDGWVKGLHNRKDNYREHYIYVENCEIWVVENLATSLATQIYLENVNLMTESIEINIKPTLLQTAKADALRIRSQLAPF